MTMASSPLGHAVDASPAVIAAIVARARNRGPRALGPYVLREQIGSGAFGRVYRAHDPKLRRDVAIKELRFGSAADLVRLEREAQALARLNHPNVVQVHDCGVADESTYFIAMELVEGSSLWAWQAQQERSLGELLAQYLHAAQGLLAIHQAGLIHRDFKPGNAIVARDGRLRILDLGLVRAQGTLLPRPPAAITTSGTPTSSSRIEPSDDSPHDDTTGDDTGRCVVTNPRATQQTDPEGEASCGDDVLELADAKTRAGFVGTPRYAAPEQLQGSQIDARADQYSFCVALFEAVCGAHPTVGHSFGPDQGSVQDLPWPKDLRSVPRWLRQLLARGLSEQPDERYPSLEPIVAELERRCAPRHRWPWVLAVASLAIGLVLATLLQSTPERCGDFRDALLGVWDDDGRAAVQRGLSPEGDVSGRGSLVVAGLDDYAERWRDERQRACQARLTEDASTSGTSRGSMASERIACLQQQRDDLGSIAAMLAEAPRPHEESVLIDDTSLWSALPLDPRLCQSTSLGPRLEPAEPEQARAAQTLLRRARVARISGQYAQSLQWSQQALAAAEAVGHGPLVAAATYQRGIARSLSGDHRLAHDDLYAASLLAERERTPVLQIEALAQLVQNEAVARNRSGLPLSEDAEGQATLAIDLAAAKVETLGIPDTTLEAWVHSSAGHLFAVRGDLERADVEYVRAIESFRRTRGPDDFVTAGFEINRAVFLARRPDQLESARTLAEDALQRRIAAGGLAHPLVARDVFSVGKIRVLAGDLEGAQQLYEQAARLFIAREGNGVGDLAEVLVELASLHRKVDPPAAIAELERAQAMLATLPDDAVPSKRLRWASVAMRVYNDAQRWESLEQAATESLAQLHTLGRDGARAIATSAKILVHAKLSLGKLCDANEQLQRYTSQLSEYESSYVQRQRQAFADGMRACSPQSGTPMP